MLRCPGCFSEAQFSNTKFFWTLYEGGSPLFFFVQKVSVSNQDLSSILIEIFVYTFLKFLAFFGRFPRLNDYDPECSIFSI